MSFGRKGDNTSGRNPPFDIASSAAAQSSGGAGNKDAYIGKGSKIVGNLQFSGPIELDGQVDGEVVAQDRLTIGESAVINAKLSGTEVIVRGQVSGDIHASKRLVLKKPARVVGSLTAPLLSIEEGVLFEGKIAMIAAEKNLKESELKDFLTLYIIFFTINDINKEIS